MNIIFIAYCFTHYKHYLVEKNKTKNYKVSSDNELKLVRGKECMRNLDRD